MENNVHEYPLANTGQHGVKEKCNTSMPVVRTGVYPHMSIADHREIQIVYNNGHHRPSGTLFLTPHTVRGSPASLSH